MNIEGQEMETYQFFVVPTGNAKITEEPEFHPIALLLKYQARENLDDKEAPKDSVAPSNNIEEAKEDFVEPSAEIYKTNKESTRT